jgi:hypothetical protein
VEKMRGLALDLEADIFYGRLDETPSANATPEAAVPPRHDIS